MGSTILQSLPQRVEGLKLFESFESANFTVDQGWTVVNGTPSISNAVARQGLRSFIMDSTYPQIQYTTTAAYYMSAGYFYDDASVVGSTFKPFIIWQDTVAALIYGLGVNDAIMSGRYVMKNGSGGDSSTGILRTTGWHRFEYIYLTATGTLKLLIDGVVVKTQVVVFNPKVIKVGASAFTGTPIFGYFDWIQVMASPFISVYGLDAGQKLSVYDTTNTLVGTAAVAASGHADVDCTGINAPFDGSLVITKADGVRPYYRSGTLSLSPGDTFLLNVYDFGRRPTMFDPKPTAVRSDTESVFGNNQSVFFNDRDTVMISFTDLTEDQKNDLQRWWTTAKRGEIFSVAIDQDQIYLARTTAAPAAPVYPTGTLTVDTIIGANKGAHLMAYTSGGRIREHVQVASATGSILTLTAPQAEAIEADMLVRALYYWPYCITKDKTLNWTLTNVKLKRWTVTLTFKEAIL